MCNIVTFIPPERIERISSSEPDKNINDDGKLQLSGTKNTGITSATFLALNDEQFYNTGLYLKIEFVKDGNGKVTGLKGIKMDGI